MYCRYMYMYIGIFSSDQTHSQLCLSFELVCDGQRHCSDGSDESEATCTCDADEEFRCSNGSAIHSPSACIPQRFHCDRILDCRDQSDEEDCDFSCPTSR